MAEVVAGLSKNSNGIVACVAVPVAPLFKYLPLVTDVRDPAVSPMPIGVAPRISRNATRTSALAPTSTLAIISIFFALVLGVMVTDNPVMSVQVALAVVVKVSDFVVLKERGRAVFICAVVEYAVRSVCAEASSTNSVPVQTLAFLAN